MFFEAYLRVITFSRNNLLAFGNSKGSKQLKGVSPVSYYREKGLYKYTYGENTDYNKILRMKRNITPKFKDAFIIAFKNGEKMNVNEAIKEFKKNR